MAPEWSSHSRRRRGASRYDEGYGQAQASMSGRGRGTLVGCNGEDRVLEGLVGFLAALFSITLILGAFDNIKGRINLRVARSEP